ncbi:MAG: hypothetical protein Q9218_002878 [Villophora microphyllina]
MFSLPSRPSFGTKGPPISLRTNYFKMLTKPGAEIFRYNIEIEPAIKNPKGEPNRRKIRRLVELLITSDEHLRKADVATDYGKFIFSAAKLFTGDRTSIVLTQKFYAFGPLSNRSNLACRLVNNEPRFPIGHEARPASYRCLQSQQELEEPL